MIWICLISLRLLTVPRVNITSDILITSLTLDMQELMSYLFIYLFIYLLDMDWIVLLY